MNKDKVKRISSDYWESRLKVNQIKIAIRLHTLKYMALTLICTLMYGLFPLSLVYLFGFVIITFGAWELSDLFNQLKMANQDNITNRNRLMRQG